MKTLVWFRGKDLRVSDHAPLTEALRGNAGGRDEGSVLPVFVLDPYFFAPEAARELPHRIQFLLDALAALAKNLGHLGSRLIVVAGKSTRVIPELAARWKVDRVVAHRWTEPFGRKRDTIIADRLRAAGSRLELFEGETLRPPGALRTKTGTPFAVYTPFSRAFRAATPLEAPLPAPKTLPAVPTDLGVTEVPIPTLEALGLTRNDQLQIGGERAARERLDHFRAERLRGYEDARDRMDLAGTSRLSADLKFGTISARTVWHAAESVAAAASDEALRTDRDKFTNELLWREFTHALLWERPELLESPFRKDFVGFPWRNDDDAWHAWTTGTTGYPIVDASARQLLAEGYVHNRARMISASFFTKHLLGDYRRAEAHYMKWLTDGDWAQNNAGWQWSAGCGADAQPYFRIFNPKTQGKKFDPEGVYVKRWVPELRSLDAKFIHAPYDAPALVLRAAGITLGRDYPLPIVVHEAARARFLETAAGHLKKKHVVLAR